MSLELGLDLPSVLGAGAPRATSFSGTKSLLLAVLEDGIRSYLSPVKEIRLEAEYWVAQRPSSARRSASW